MERGGYSKSLKVFQMKRAYYSIQEFFNEIIAVVNFKFISGYYYHFRLICDLIEQAYA